MSGSVHMAVYADLQKKIPAEITEECCVSALSHPPNDWSEVSDWLSEGQFDACMMELKEIPFGKDGLTIAALVRMDLPQYFLVINREKVFPECDLRLAPGSVVGVTSAYVKSQVEYLNPMLQCRILSDTPISGENDFAVCDAYVVSVLSTEQIAVPQADVFPIHKTEIWPETGAGVWALVTHRENQTAFRTLRKRHDFSISDVTNPARDLCLKASEKGVTDIQAYCQTDALGHYHLYAIRYDGQVQRHRISQSTHDLLTERMLSALNF